MSNISASVIVALDLFCLAVVVYDLCSSLNQVVAMPARLISMNEDVRKAYTEMNSGTCSVSSVYTL